MPPQAEPSVAPGPTAAEARRGARVVAIGASAGWFEALSELLEALPRDTGLAFVVVVHLDPRHGSQMAGVLQRMTRMPVREVQQDMPVEPDHVYVIPSTARLTIREGVLHLTKREPGKADTHVIDGFFRSLAEDAGPEAMGVVLSGTLSDGTQGLRDIRAAGGFTFAQSVESAKHREMPWNAIASGSVDSALPPGDLARELARLAAGGPEAAGALEEADVEELLKVLRAGTGVDFSQYKRSTVRRRIQRRMMARRKDALKDYTDLVRGDPQEAHLLHEEMLIHVTRFFREPETLEFLRDRVLPGLVKGRGQDEPLRVWVAGCATGEEAYSLAILIQEYLQAEGLSVPVNIFATDISEKAIRVAREGLYPESIEQVVSQERLVRHFVRAEGGYRVSKAVRGLCVFAVHNLVADPPFSGIDIATCRNVLVYLATDLQRKALRTLHYALTPSGCLVLGTSESLGGSDGLFEGVDRDHKVFLKRTGSPRPQAPPAGAWPPATAPRRAQLTRRHAPWSERDLFRQADHIFLERASPAGVVVNRGLDVLHFRGDTTPYLQPPQGPASLNLLKLARGSLGLELRRLVDEALAGAVVRKERVRLAGAGSATVEVIPLDGRSQEEPFFLVMFAADPGPARPAAGAREGWWARRSGGGRTASGEAARRLAAAEGEVLAMRAYLQRVVEENETAVEELRSADEEAVSTNEELQSTNEELETAKEELQSTNEELNTLNDELQQRNADVQKVNNDLLNVLNSMALPIIILGPDLRIRRFTPRSQKVLNLLPTDIGRPITDLQQPFMADLRSEVLEVLGSFAPREVDVRDQRGNHFALTIHPYRTDDNRVDGVVLAFLPPDLAKRRSAGVEEAFAAAEALTETIFDPVVVLDAGLRIRAANGPFFQLLGLPEDGAHGKAILALRTGLTTSDDFRRLLSSLQGGGSPVRELPVALAPAADGPGARLVVNAKTFQPSGEDVLIVVAFRPAAPPER